jgi:hypothetical protein
LPNALQQQFVSLMVSSPRWNGPSANSPPDDNRLCGTARASSPQAGVVATIHLKAFVELDVGV